MQETSRVLEIEPHNHIYSETTLPRGLASVFFILVFINFKGASLLKVQEKASNQEAESLDITLFTKRTNICRVALAIVTSVTKGHLPPEGTGMNT